jgi:hypothetical protein
MLILRVINGQKMLFDHSFLYIIYIAGVIETSQK